MKNISFMGVQRLATARNAEVELFVGFVLQEYCEALLSEGRIADYDIEVQKHYESEIASDVWDHYVEFFDLVLKTDVRLWCQTTCYKGNASGKPEPNKTYEVRETLVEAISLRAAGTVPDKTVRTVHFTVGPKQYAYGWFAAVKEKSFDLSLYLNSSRTDVFELVRTAFAGEQVEFQIKKRLLKEVKDGSELGNVVRRAVEQLLEWHIGHNLAEQDLASKQGQLVATELKTRRDEIEACIAGSANRGLDIKKKCNELIHGSGVTGDSVIMLTVEQLLAKNPFVSYALNTLVNWGGFQQYITRTASASTSIDDLVFALWSEASDVKMLTRRLLLRTQATESINYIQDLGVNGVTEHNLYRGEHTTVQARQIVAKIVTRLKAQQISTAGQLCAVLVGANAKLLLRQSIWFEGRNGTDLKPSFDYIRNAITSKNDFLVIPGSRLKPKPVGYHASLAAAGDTVNAYTNLSAICDKQGSVLAILKGKYFRQQEFPRRCKEESYVALTLKHRLDKAGFSIGRDIPLIMFVDMAENATPPPYAIRRLMAFGWHIAFSYEDVVNIIASR